jgi:hypothetical protein
MCRREGYYSRPYRAAAAIVQRHAVTKLQAWARGLAARRSYLAARLQTNPGFHSDYYYTKLRRYADAMLCRAMQREKTVDDVIAEATHRSALARLMLLDGADWDAIRADTFRRNTNTRTGGAGTSAPQSSFDCPICLGAVQPLARPASAPVPTGPGFRLERVPDAAAPKPGQGGKPEKPVAALGRANASPRGRSGDGGGGGALRGRNAAGPAAHRAAGADRREAKSAAPAAAARHNPVPTRRQPSSSSSLQRAGPASAPRKEPPALAPMRVVFDAAPAAVPPAKVPTGRDAVVTSCGHCFHAQCIAAFERHAGAAPFVAGQPEGGASDAALEIAKCPCCRAVYASAAFYPSRSDAGCAGPPHAM